MKVETKKVVTIWVWAAILFIIVAVMWGCDAQSPNARMCNEFGVTMLAPPSYPDWTFDVWRVEPDESGSEIYGAAFGFIVRVETPAGTPLAGIRVECYLNDFSAAGPDYNIFKDTAPNGMDYGYVTVLPEGGSDWDYDDRTAKGRTNIDGECLFFIGLGDPLSGIEPPEPNLVYGYRWPGGCDTMVDTVVDIEFKIRRNSGDMESYGYCHFIRAQCQDFFLPHGGSFGNSYSSLGSMGSMSMSTNLNEQTLSEDVLAKFKKPKKDKWKAMKKKAAAPLVFFDSASESHVLGMDPNSPPEPTYDVTSLGWYRFGWSYLHDSWAWFLVEDELALHWIEDPNNPTEENMASLAAGSAPYAYFIAVTGDDLPASYAARHTAVLISRYADGREASRFPVHIDYWGSKPNLDFFVSDYVIPMESIGEQGVTQSPDGEKVILIWVPDGGHLDIIRNELSGDLDLDGWVNGKDLAILTAAFDKDVFSNDYDLICDLNDDYVTNIEDLYIFSTQWLTAR